jgi:hypothetical protein
MPCQHQVEFAAGELLHPGRVMEQQHVLNPWLWFDGWRLVARDPDHIQLPSARARLLIQKPLPASRRKRPSDGVEVDLRPVVMVAWYSVKRGADLLQELERFGQKGRVLDNVARKANQIGFEVVDSGNNPRQVAAIAFVMQIGEVNNSMG